MNKIFDNLEREKKLQSVVDNWMDSLLHVKPNKCHFLKFKFEIQNGLCLRLISDIFSFSGRFSAILIHLIDGLNLVADRFRWRSDPPAGSVHFNDEGWCTDSPSLVRTKRRLPINNYSSKVHFTAMIYKLYRKRLI